MKRNRLKSLVLGTLTSVIMLSVVGCGEKKDERPIACGYMWKVENGENPMYLVGTMHPGSNEYNYINEELKEVIHDSDILGVEVHMTPEKNEKYSGSLIYPGNETVEDNLTPDELEKLKKICLDIGLPYETAKKYKPVLLNSSISSYASTKAGLDGTVSLDRQLILSYEKDKKEIVELEGYQYQNEVLDQVYDIKMLKEVINSYEGIDGISDSVEYAKKLHDSYIKGEDDFASEAVKSYQEDLRVYNLLIKDRNVRMADKVESYLKDDKKYVVAVGYLHYFGDDSLVNVLKERGYTVERVEI